MLTAVLCYAQPLNNGICYFFRLPLSVTPIQILPVNKKTKKFRTNSIYYEIFIYIHKNLFGPQAPDLLEKLAESLLYNFHHEHILLKIEDKIVIAKN